MFEKYGIDYIHVSCWGGNQYGVSYTNADGKYYEIPGKWRDFISHSFEITTGINSGLYSKKDFNELESVDEIPNPFNKTLKEKISSLEDKIQIILEKIEKI